MSAAADRTCARCGKTFAKKYGLQRHLRNKRPCAPIVEDQDLPAALLEDPEHEKRKCRYCGRAFSSQSNAIRHMRTVCKIAPTERNGDAGMKVLYEHTLRKHLEEMNVKMERQQATIERLEKLVLEGSGAVHNNITIDNSTTINEGPTFVYNAPGHEDLSPLTQRWIQDVFESEASSHEILAAGFAVVCCDSRLKGNHLYYAPNKKDPDIVLVRENGRWRARPPITAFVPAVNHLAAHIMKPFNQPNNPDTADITGPKVDKVRPLERAKVVPAGLAASMWKRLKPRPHGELTAEELRASRRPAGEAATEPRGGGGEARDPDDPDDLDAWASDFE